MKHHQMPILFDIEELRGLVIAELQATIDSVCSGDTDIDTNICELVLSMALISKLFSRIDEHLLLFKTGSDTFVLDDQNSTNCPKHLKKSFKQVVESCLMIVDLTPTTEGKCFVTSRLFYMLASIPLKTCLYLDKSNTFFATVAEKCRELATEDHKGILLNLPMWEARFNYIVYVQGINEEERQKIVDESVENHRYYNALA
jgi:hypothetical protein